jgi:integrase
LDLVLMLAASVQKYGGDMMVTNGAGRPCAPWVIAPAMADVRELIEGLPESLTFHDLRHYFASLLIASGADVKTVQARLRHASATTTLDTYAHLWPDADESTNAAVSAVITARLAAGG